jgi:quinol-cytochrome oxidoreductase complex cytochrome b subunit
MTSMNKRLAMESFLVTLLFIIGFVAWNVVQGMIRTMNYVPDLMNTASSVTPLQSKVAFGTLVRWDSTSMILAVAGFILLAAAYYGLRSGMQRWTQRS